MEPAPNFALSRLTQPDIEPVTLDEMKRHLREYDTLSPGQILDIEAQIKAAREWVENETSRALIDQVWRLAVNDVPTDSKILLRRSPVIEVVHVASVDAQGRATQIDVAGVQLYERNGKWPYIIIGAAYTRLLIDFRAGYVDRTVTPVGTPLPSPPPPVPPTEPDPSHDLSAVPERFKLAMKLYAEANYERDKEMMPLLLEAARNLIKPERVDLQSV